MKVIMLSDLRDKNMSINLNTLLNRYYKYPYGAPSDCIEGVEEILYKGELPHLMMLIGLLNIVENNKLVSDNVLKVTKTVVGGGDFYLYVWIDEKVSGNKVYKEIEEILSEYFILN